MIASRLCPVFDPDKTGLNFSGNNVATAAPALERLGAQGPFDPGYHGSYAFSGCTGSAPRFYTKAEVRPRYHGPAIVAQLIPTPAAQKGLCLSSISNTKWCGFSDFQVTRSNILNTS